MIDVSGKRYGRLVAVSFQEFRGRTAYWLCQCDCGKEKSISIYSLKNGKTHSCGCLSSEMTSIRTRSHGRCKTPEYSVWAGMLARCTNTKTQSYKNYGGRNITVSEEWKQFDNFYNDMGERPFKDAQIDRIDNDKGYSRENCRWATPKENARNTRRTKKVYYNGEERKLIDIIGEMELSKPTVLKRLYLGWPVEKAIEEPVSKWTKNDTVIVFFRGKNRKLVELCKEFSISYNAVHKRIHNRGWDTEKAILTPAREDSWKRKVKQNV